MSRFANIGDALEYLKSVSTDQSPQNDTRVARIEEKVKKTLADIDSMTRSQEERWVLKHQADHLSLDYCEARPELYLEIEFSDATQYGTCDGHVVFLDLHTLAVVTVRIDLA